jgi:hypothetical protein
VRLHVTYSATLVDVSAFVRSNTLLSSSSFSKASFRALHLTTIRWISCGFTEKDLVSFLVSLSSTLDGKLLAVERLLDRKLLAVERQPDRKLSHDSGLSPR